MSIKLILDEASHLPIEHQAYILATAHHETGGTFKPVREAFGKTDGQTINRLERAWTGGKLPQVVVPYWRPDTTGKAWFGRGFVQLTHRSNYERAAHFLGIDLLGDPSLAMQPRIAARILVRGMVDGWFTGKRLDDYLPGNYVAARRIINGTDRAEKIARLAVGYERQIRAAKPQSPWAALIRAVVAFLAGILARK